MTTKDTRKNEGLQTIEHKTEISPAFETDINPIAVLEVLDEYIEALSNNPDENVIRRIESELQSLEIITINHGEKSWWINDTFVLHQYVMKRPMTKRISHLLKTKGEWKKEHVREDNLEVKSRVCLPIVVGIQPEAEAGVKKGEISTLLLSVIGIHNTIQAMLKNGASTCGVFQKPDGVVHLNRLRTWLEENENRGTHRRRFVQSEGDTLVLPHP